MTKKQLETHDRRERAANLAADRAGRALNQTELDVLRHATSWGDGQPLWRNHYCSGPSCDNWTMLRDLVNCGLMFVRRLPSELSGSDTVFAVTPAGFRALAYFDALNTGKVAS